jgi:hypothetical protein
MISEQGLHWARHEVERRLSALDEESRWETHDAFIFFKSKGVDPNEVYWLLAKECLRVEGAKNRFKNRLTLADAAVAHLTHADNIRSFVREAFEKEIESLRRGIAAPNLPHPGVFRGIEHVREYLRAYPAAEKAALELYGLAAEEVEAVDRVERGSIGHFAYEMDHRVGRSHDQQVAALIGPAIDWPRLEGKTVRNCLNAFRKKYV